jgi:hypothetical protein
MATTRERLHEMLDLLAEDRLADAEVALAHLADPMALALLNAPEDDEETTDEDIADLDATRAAYQRGETISHEEILREFGV